MTLTPKQESFCLKFIELGNASEAYRQSYDARRMKPASINRKAKELTDKVKIAARIKELQAAHAQRHNVTVDSLTAELNEARHKALEQENPMAMIAASMSKAKLHGLLKNKVEVNSVDHAAILEERIAAAEKLRKRLN